MIYSEFQEDWQIFLLSIFPINQNDLKIKASTQTLLHCQVLKTLF